MKHKPLSNGRDKKAPNGFSMVSTEIQRSVAFRSLSQSAMRLLLWALWKQYHAATNRGKGDRGNPQFRLTNAEALNELKMGSATFSRAKDELAEKGFMSWLKRGGLRGCNGIASEYILESDWKQWEEPPDKPKRKPPQKTVRGHPG